MPSPIPGCLFIAMIAVCFKPATTYSQNSPAGALSLNVIDTSARAQVFAPGIVSSPYTEWATSFMPDGKTVYFSRGAVYWTIVSAKLINGKWDKPEVASFSGKWNDTDPFVSPNGKRLFFISNRPLTGDAPDKPEKFYHIWYVDRSSGDDWGTPHHLDAPVNITGESNYAASVDSKGTLYFCSRDREGHKGMQSYVAPWVGDHYEQPRLIAFSGLDESQDPFIAPDDRYLVLLSGNDIFIAFRQGNSWLAAQKLGPQVNNGDANSSPCVSPDGKMLYYSSPRIQGFYKRDRVNHTLNYDELTRENESLFNSQPNILMIPVNIPKSMG